MTRRDIVAIVTVYVVVVVGLLYWRATRPHATGLIMSNGAGEAIKDCPVGSYFTDDPKTGKFSCVKAAILTYLEVAENGRIRIRGGRSVEPCKVGALWTDAEGRHECVEYHEPAPGECDLGDVYLGDDGIWSQCLPSDVWWLIGECSDGKRLTPEGKIVACEEPKP
jgi:hypothetical protein